MAVRGSILIIDDEAILRHSLTRILQGEGHQVTTAASGPEGLDYLSQQPFDLVYLDIRMPEMSGLEVLRVIHQKFPLVPVVLFTAQPDLNSAIQAMRYGATDYLLKPLSPNTVIGRTNALLEQQEIDRKKRAIQAQIDLLQTELLNLGTSKANSVNTMVKEVDSSERYLIRGRLKFDLHARRLMVGKSVIELQPTSYDLLLVLARHSPKAVDYQTLVAEAQGYQTDRLEAKDLVKWHIHHIRQAIEPKGSKPKYVINIRGIGYRLVTD